METKQATEPHRNGRPSKARSARAARNKVAPKTTRAPRRAIADRAPHIGRMIAFSAVIVLGAVVVLGAGSLAALLAGFEPPGYKAKARRFRRNAIAYIPDVSRANDLFEPVGRRIAQGEHWMRDKVLNGKR